MVWHAISQPTSSSTCVVSINFNPVTLIHTHWHGHHHNHRWGVVAHTWNNKAEAGENWPVLDQPGLYNETLFQTRINTKAQDTKLNKENT